MAATPAQTLLNEAKCFICIQDATVAQALRIALERRTLLALNPAADTSPEALLAYGKCYACLPGTSEVDAIELAILDQIQQAL